MHNKRSLRSSTFQPDWRFVLPYGLVTLGAASPVARSLLTVPVLSQVGLLLPPLLLLMWLVWRRMQSHSMLRSPLAPLLLVAAAALVVSSLFGVAESSARLAVLIQWTISGLLLFLTVDLLASGWQPRVFVRGVLMVISAVLLFATVNIGGWLAHWLLLWRPGEQLLLVGYRLTVLGMHPNLVAMLLNIGLPCAIVGLWAATRFWQRIIWLVWLALAVPALLFTSSRGGWLGMGASAGVTLACLLGSDYRARRWRHMWLTIFATCCYSALFGGLFLSQRNEVLGQHGGNLLSPVGRFSFWHRALLVFTEHPLLGAGPAGFNARYNATEVFSLFFQPQHAHSLYLTTLSELGVVGSLALLALIVAAAITWQRAWRMAAPLASTADPWHGRILLLATGAVGVGMLIHGLVDTPPPLIAGLVLCLVATGLNEGGCWQTAADAPRPLRHNQRPASALGLIDGTSASVGFSIFGFWSLHLTLLVVTALAWGSYALVSRQGGRWQALVTAADDALAMGNNERAEALAEQATAILPERGDAYSLRAIARATRARDEPRWLTAAVTAQDDVILYDPANHAAPLNRAQLLVELGQHAQAERELRTFIAADTTNWGVPVVMLAHLREIAGDTTEARALWQRALQQQADLHDTAACEHSSVCTSLVPPDSTYSILLAARQAMAQPDAATIQSIADQASAWQSVDLWAMSALLAEQTGDVHAAQRYLQAAEDQSQVIGSTSTEQLGIAQLQAAMMRGNRSEAQELLRQWLAPRTPMFVPQLNRLLVTQTDVDFARTAVITATWLGDPVALARAQAYLRETQVVAFH